MNQMDVIALLGLCAAVSITIITVARAIANRHRDGSPEEVRALEERIGRLEQSEERIARLEHAVQALTVDSGRLIDGQRSLSQLLAERSAAAQPVGRSDRA